MKELRDYQEKNAWKLRDILFNKGVAYFSAMVRTGKTATSLEVCKMLECNNVLFITKKKAMSSIREDYSDFGYTFNLELINYESVHKVDQTGWDMVIIDEAHSLGAFPKPSNRAKNIRGLIAMNKCYVLMLSGTATPESFSQIYHQFWVSGRGPWVIYTSFYKWANVYVDKKQKRIGTHVVNDYSKGNESKIFKDIAPYMVSFTQEQAGFKSKVDEEVIHVKMKDATYRLINRLMKDLVIEGKEEFILADTPAKLRQKHHQLSSGTIKFDSGNRMVLDHSKANYIYSQFGGKKLAIFYVYKAELTALKDVFGDKITESIEEFNKTDKHIALQIVSGREGTNLSKADLLIMYNIHDSATSYWQGKDRQTTADRLFNKVVWVFADGGIEDMIYKTVTKKKTNYTTAHYKKDFKLK